MAPPTLIPDASVLVKLWVVEAGSDQARFLRDLFIRGEVEFAVPSLAYVEVANAFRFNKDTRSLDVSEDLQDLLDLGMETVEPSAEVVTAAYREARAIGSSVYDAMYLVVAKQRKGIMVTSDLKFDRLARSKHVAPLGKVYRELAG